MRAAIPGNPWLPLIFLGLFSVFALMRAIHSRAARAREAAPAVRTQPEDRWLHRLRIALSGILAVVVAIYGFWHVFGWFGWMAWFRLPFPDLVRWIAAGAAGAALVMLQRVYDDLGSGFSVSLRVRPDHDLVTGGWYARIRHPMYAALSAFFVSASLASGHGLVVALGAGITAMLWLRTGREERMMEAHFGEAYRLYRARTGRFLPRFRPVTRRTRTD